MPDLNLETIEKRPRIIKALREIIREENLGDNIIEDEEGANLMITNLSCPGCEASVDVYLPVADTDVMAEG